MEVHFLQRRRNKPLGLGGELGGCRAVECLLYHSRKELLLPPHRQLCVQKDLEGLICSGSAGLTPTINNSDFIPHPPPLLRECGAVREHFENRWEETRQARFIFTGSLRYHDLAASTNKQKKTVKKDGCVGHQKDEARLTVLYLKKKKKKKEHCIVSRLLFCLWSSDGKLPAFTSGLNLWEGLSHYTTPACVILVTLCSNTKPFWVHEILDIGRSVSAILCTSILQMFLLNLYLPSSVCTVSMFFFFFALLHSRSVSCSQRGLQSPVHRGTGERGCVFLSPWASPGLQQQDVWGGGLLQPPPKVQPGVWAVQDHGEVLLLPGMGARPRWRQLSQHR